jgi:serine/threonine protein phosphatase PrpC
MEHKVRQQLEILLGSRSDRGRRRRRNEDRALARTTNDTNGSPLCFLAVADGMGGVPGGELASEIAIRTLDSGFQPAIALDPVTSLRTLFQEANAEIRRLAESNPAIEGMGSTLVAALVAKNALWVANVGDSRAYLIRNGTIRQLTEDHSWVAEQVKAGQMSRTEAAGSPRRNVITRSLGTAQAVDVDLFRFEEMEPGDILLLCSDGLYNMVLAEDIPAIAVAYPPQEAADRLVELANKKGGTDNIAVVMAALPSGVREGQGT